MIVSHGRNPISHGPDPGGTSHVLFSKERDCQDNKAYLERCNRSDSHTTFLLVNLSCQLASSDMDPTVGMLLVVSLMFVGALVAGISPFFIEVKASRVNLLSGIGGGLLLGTALSIVIPEGFESISSQVGQGGLRHEARWDSWMQPHLAIAPYMTFSALSAQAHAGGLEGEHGDESGGFILVVGFLIMLILDRARPHAEHMHVHSHETTPVKSMRAVASATAPSAPRTSSRALLADSAVLGLVLHCVADGLALGAAAVADDTRLSMIVSVAMLAHKVGSAAELAQRVC